ncbi:MAG TPA: cyclic nucleotide-binding domain-containing protein [Gammaproteobacteria bacterium]|nr:cyclic nucleotide-binding domain-containing protein [Gammaproteobacteria bacterium]
MTDKTDIDIERLSKLEPISALSPERLQELVSLSYVEHLPMGVSVFREGDVDNQTVYLLKGDVQLSSSDGSIDRAVSARSEQACHPLEDSQPRQASCTALSNIEIVRIDNSVLDYMMMWDQLADEAIAELDTTGQHTKVAENQAGYDSGAAAEAKPAEAKPAGVKPAEAKPAEAKPAEAKPTEAKPTEAKPTEAKPTEAKSAEAKPTEAKPAEAKPAEAKPAEGKTAGTASTGEHSAPSGARPGEWMRKMHHIMAFKNLPPANIKALLQRMERIQVNEGDVIVSQGSPGDYYYVLVDGAARVTRTIELATLRPGASFGEEALVTGTERNATVTMTRPGAVMRLAKADFDELLREPMVNRVSPDEARVQIEKGARWLDVRHAREFSHGHFQNALSIPLHELRVRMGELDKSIPYICCCRTGHRSSAAAFLLVQKGFNASVLTGGIQVMPQDLVK